MGFCYVAFRYLYTSGISRTKFLAANENIIQKFVDVIKRKLTWDNLN